MEHVPRRLIRWTLIVALVIWVVSLGGIVWGLWQTYTDERQLIEMLLAGRK